MRRARFKAEASVQVAHYHCVSRVVDRNFVLGELEKETFVKLMRRYETYCGVRVLSFCIMTNHFHILLESETQGTDTVIHNKLQQQRLFVWNHEISILQ
jgi:putative transposase